MPRNINEIERSWIRLQDITAPKCTDYWMFYRGSWFGSSPTYSPPSVSSTGDTHEERETEATWWWERGEGGGRGAESYDRKKGWSSINHKFVQKLSIKFDKIRFKNTTPTKESNFSVSGRIFRPEQSWQSGPERTISLRFLGIILGVLRLEVSVYNVYITNQF